MFFKMPKEYKIFKSARSKAQNDHLNLVDNLIERINQGEVISSPTDNDDLTYHEMIPFYWKDFFVQCFALSGGGYRCFGKLELPKRSIFEKPRFIQYWSDGICESEKTAVKQVLDHIDKFRQAKPNDNRVGK